MERKKRKENKKKERNIFHLTEQPTAVGKFTLTHSHTLFLSLYVSYSFTPEKEA